MKTDSESYTQKKVFLEKILTVFGRKPVLEVINDTSVTVHRVHLSDSNKPAKIIQDIETAAKRRNIEICYHTKHALSRISKNAKQDQGVAADIFLKGYLELRQFIQSKRDAPFTLLALDKVTNPQNVGMIIRSVCASPATGLIIPNKGCAKLDSLVIKASAGTLFKAPILRCDALEDSLTLLANTGANIIGLDAHSSLKISDIDTNGKNVFVLGNETDGLSENIRALCTHYVGITMNNHVESLNVAVTASLIAFYGAL